MLKVFISYSHKNRDALPLRPIRFSLSLLNAPADDEPYTDEQRQRDAEAEASIAGGGGISHEKILSEFGI